MAAPGAALRSIDRGAWLKWALGLVGGAIAVLVAMKLFPLLPHTELRGKWQTPFPVVLLGIIIGLTYGLLGVGLVLIYRSNRIINFAHGEVGAFAAAVFALIVVRWHFPYWVAFPLMLVLGGGIGALVETAVVRRLRSAPRLMTVVATLGVAQFLVALALAINSEAQAGSVFPNPSGLFEFDVGALHVSKPYVGMLIFSPLVVIALAVFLKRSRFGLGILGAAANNEVARLSGISASRMSSLAWALAGALSAFTAILTLPTQGSAGAAFFGPNLLMRALACAVIARMSNFAVALVAGTAVGIVEQLVLYNYGQGSLMNIVLFVAIVGALLLQRQKGAREDERGSWAAVQALRPIPDAWKQLWIARNLGRVIAVAGLTIAIGLSFVVTSARAITLTAMLGYAIVGLSVGVITALGGQLTLGQFALAGIGGLASVLVAQRTGNFLLAFVYAGAAGAGASLLIGLPALRIKGLMLTVTTLAFALLLPGWLLAQTWAIGPVALTVPQVSFFGITVGVGTDYYLFAIVIFVAVLWLTRNIWRGGVGRVLRAIRDNEDNARAFTVPATATKMRAFLLSGFIAGLGGALYAHSLTALGTSSFPSEVSIRVVTMMVVGGVSLMAGPLLGVLLVMGTPLLNLDNAGIAATQFGILLIILYLPGGLGSLVEPARNRILRWFARRAGIEEEPGDVTETEDKEHSFDAAVTSREVPAVRPLLPTRRAVPGEKLLVATGLVKSFGGITAVNGVSLDVYSDELVGVIGPNGAGKTTMFELLAGFTRLDEGTVEFDGRDVTWMGPEDRGRLGLIRSFQDASLFPTMSVLEVVQLALERVAPTRIVSSALGFHGLDRAKERRARDIISFMGLDFYRGKQVRELSTGTRRIVELACMVALEPALLLLDEPSSGIAQRETEALGALLTELKTQFNMTMLIIEHDIPLIMGLSDRIIAMADGKVIASGPPDIVRDDPQVIESYLGGSSAAIERSGELSQTFLTEYPSRERSPA